MVGVFGGAYLVPKLTHAELDADLDWTGVVAIAALSGIGFTESLLIDELAFAGTERTEHVKIAVLVGSVVSATLAAALLRARNAHYRQASRADSPATEPS